jgi:hypothetical protein
MDTRQETFNPTETWQLDEPLEAYILKARRLMNEKDPKQLISQLQQQVKRSKNGITYAVLKGDKPEEYSESEALIVFNPFANAATPNMLVRSEFIREVAKQANIRDDESKLKPVVMLASPGIIGSSLKLSKEERYRIRHGDLGPAATEMLKAVSAEDIGKVSLLGFSQGADMALAGARVAYESNLDNQSLSIGEPASSQSRTVLELGKDFISSPPPGSYIERAGINAQAEAVAKGRYEWQRFAGSVLTSPVNNIDLIFGMARSPFEKHMQEVLDSGLEGQVVVGYGTDSKISRPEYIEPSLEKLHESDNAGLLTSIKVNGAGHGWGDQLTLLAKLYMRALI